MKKYGRSYQGLNVDMEPWLLRAPREYWDSEENVFKDGSKDDLLQIETIEELREVLVKLPKLLAVANGRLKLFRPGGRNLLKIGPLAEDENPTVQDVQEFLNWLEERQHLLPRDAAVHNEDGELGVRVRVIGGEQYAVEFLA